MKSHAKSRGIRRVFAFTTRMTTTSRSWRTVTILLAALLFLTPVVTLFLIEALSDDTVTVYSGSIARVYTVDQTMSETDMDLSVLGQYDPRFEAISYTAVETYADSVAKAETDSHALILVLSEDESGYTLDLVLPTDTDLVQDDVDLYMDAWNTLFPHILLGMTGISAEDYLYATLPIWSTDLHALDVDESDSGEEEAVGAEILRMLLPYLTVMFLYFFVLFYGQSVAQLVVMEKTSKLMDIILVSTQPVDLIFGKVFACLFCAIVQLFSWILALIGGFACGGMLAERINPHTSLNIFRLLRESDVFTGILTPLSGLVALFLVLAGCLLYCSLASVGGALAGKQEDLQSTNLLFTMALVISFLVVLFSGDVMSGHIASGAPWMHWVPFTAVLITPARVLLGDVSLAVGIGSLTVTLLVSSGIMYGAGRLYTAMSFYKGNPPKIFRLLTKRYRM